MCVFRTAIQKKDELLPTQLEFLEMAKQRGLPLNDEDRKLLYTLEMGEIGEKKVIELLKKYGRDHWVILRNIWIDYGSIYENDIIIITRHAVIVLEVKNFTRKFEYENGICKINGIIRPSNYIFQSQKAYINMVNICHELSSNINVYGALLFANEYSEVHINSKVDNIQTVKHKDLIDYILGIAKDEDIYTGKQINSSEIIKQLEKYETVTVHRPTSFHPNDLKNARKGIYCSKCKGYNIHHEMQSVHCSCRFTESRESAVIRTIYEFGALTFAYKHMTRRELGNFMNNQIGEDMLVRILKENFHVNYNGRYTSYQNKEISEEN